MDGVGVEGLAGVAIFVDPSGFGGCWSVSCASRF